VLTPPQRHAGLGRPVLVLDGDALRRARITALLQEEGYAVTAFDSAIDAHAQVQRGTPAVVILDLDLPYGSGRSLLLRLKADPQTARIPVIGLTATPERIPPSRRALLAALVPAPGHPGALRAALQLACGVRADA
jgi:CheY-like chemotaxis protein